MTGRLIVIAGHSGVGKSTIAQAVCKKNSWVLLDKDTLAGPLVDMWMRHHTEDPQNRSHPRYQEIRNAEYLALTGTSIEILANGVGTVCVVAPFVQPADLSELEFLVDLNRLDVSGLWVTCTAQEHRSRLVARGSARDRTKIARLHDWVSGNHDAPALPTWMSPFNNGTTKSLSGLAESVVRALEVGAVKPIGEKAE